MMFLTTTMCLVQFTSAASGGRAKQVTLKDVQTLEILRPRGLQSGDMYIAGGRARCLYNPTVVGLYDKVCTRKDELKKFPLLYDGIISRKKSPMTSSRSYTLDKSSTGLCLSERVPIYKHRDHDNFIIGDYFSGAGYHLWCYRGKDADDLEKELWCLNNWEIYRVGNGDFTTSFTDTPSYRRVLQTEFQGKLYPRLFRIYRGTGTSEGFHAIKHAIPGSTRHELNRMSGDLKKIEAAEAKYQSDLARRVQATYTKEIRHLKNKCDLWAVVKTFGPGNDLSGFKPDNLILRRYDPKAPRPSKISIRSTKPVREISAPSPKTFTQAQKKMVETVIRRGAFEGTETSVQCTGDDDLSKAGAWMECAEGVPEFVYRWYGDEWKQHVERWVVWNGKYRTLQKKISENEYYIISKWKSEECWTIENWARKRGTTIRQQCNIIYKKTNLDAPTDSDAWYEFLSGNWTSVKVLNFSRDGRTAVKGSRTVV